MWSAALAAVKAGGGVWGDEEYPVSLHQQMILPNDFPLPTLVSWGDTLWVVLNPEQ